jgi:hypothetical protein
MVAGIFRAEEEFIEALRRSRKEFTERFVMGKNSEEGSKCIRRIYEGKSSEALTGKQAKEMCNELQSGEALAKGKNDKKKLEKYAKELEQQIEKISKLREALFTTEVR